MELYKFYRLNDNFIDNIKNKRIYASTRNDLNDPFDCLSFVKVDGRKTHYRSMIQVVKKEYPKSFEGITESNDSLHRVVKDNNINLIHLLEQYESDIDPNDYFKYLADNMRLISFTENNRSHLMWAHYADSYKGIIIKYDVSIYEDKNEILTQIKYGTKPQKLKDLKDVIDYIFGHKLDDWKYEEEVRVVLDKDKTEKYYENHDLKEVYFGARFWDNGDKLIKLLKKEFEKYNDVKYFKSIITEEDYGLSYEEIIPETFFTKS